MGGVLEIGRSTYCRQNLLGYFLLSVIFMFSCFKSDRCK